jgi:hypothetical protein
VAAAGGLVNARQCALEAALSVAGVPQSVYLCWARGALLVLTSCCMFAPFCLLQDPNIVRNGRMDMLSLKEYR